MPNEKKDKGNLKSENSLIKKGCLPARLEIAFPVKGEANIYIIIIIKHVYNYMLHICIQPNPLALYSKKETIQHSTQRDASLSQLFYFLNMHIEDSIDNIVF